MPNRPRSVQHTLQRLSLFEKVILANIIMLLFEAASALWITSHSLEAHHYLIDTSFLVFATLLSLLINFLLLRASFRPLFGLLRTIRAVSAGETTTRAVAIPADSEIGELARAFNTMLDQLEASRRQQALLILQAQEEERRRLARELHDESSQNLTALLVHTEILHQMLHRLPDLSTCSETRTSLETGLHTLANLTQHTLDNVRTLALHLRPAVLDDLGLEAALRWLAEDWRQRLHIPIELHIEGLEQALHEQCEKQLYETTLFRIVQECLTNVARHAHAQNISVTFRHEQDGLCLYVADDGCGFDPEKHFTGLGLVGMCERAALLQGSLTIISHPQQGTRVEIHLPAASALERETIHA